MWLALASLLAPDAKASYALQQDLQALALDSSAALLLDAETGAVLYAKNEDLALPIASLTKLMTALLISESGLNMAEMITITSADVDRIKKTSSRLPVGTRLPRREMLRLALMSSENRAAHALARTHPKGLRHFIAMMNAQALMLGMTATQFVEPTGLSSDNRSSARDLSLLVAAARDDPLISAMSVTAEHHVRIASGQLRYVNSNALVRSGSIGAIHLQKTGFIREAGYCLVMQLELDGRPFTVVLLNAGNARARLADARKVHQWIDGQMPALDPLGLYLARLHHAGHGDQVLAE